KASPERGGGPAKLVEGFFRVIRYSKQPVSQRVTLLFFFAKKKQKKKRVRVALVLHCKSITRRLYRESSTDVKSFV
ncbi:hypothetical protein, partial [Ruminococcus callidus]|uniref:hypothetical protein n=1 Tax=Ruminococcus callidus TaxID=40519 RepID=UPI0023F971EB